MIFTSEIDYYSYKKKKKNYQKKTLAFKHLEKSGRVTTLSYALFYKFSFFFLIHAYSFIKGVLDFNISYIFRVIIIIIVQKRTQDLKIWMGGEIEIDIYSENI